MSQHDGRRCLPGRGARGVVRRAAVACRSAGQARDACRRGRAALAVVGDLKARALDVFLHALHIEEGSNYDGDNGGPV